MDIRDVFVARQPIFDRSRRAVAYELLFRDGRGGSAAFTDGDRATRDVVSHSYLTIGLDRLTGGRPAYINFTRDLLLRQTAALLPKELTVIEILEDVPPDPEVLSALRSLKRQGYVLALDDFVCQEGRKEFLDVVDIVKMDFHAAGAAQRSGEIAALRGLHGGRLRLLAEKVEDYSEFRQAMEAGFDFFQGYFFSRPEVISGKVIPGNRIAHLRLLHSIQEPSLDFKSLEGVIKTDLALTTKLLRFINAAAFPWAHEIVSLRQALVLLGEDQVRRWVALAMISDLASEKPMELAMLSSVRGRLCEQLASAVTGIRPLDAFLVGAFSLLDALLDTPMDRVLAQVPLPPEAHAALSGEPCPLRQILNLAVAYETGQWGTVSTLASKLAVAENAISACYLDSLDWTRLAFGQAA
jgi:c-di-GMP-related signal transduction protein